MLEIVNPTSEETIDRLESDSPETIAAKFEAARESQPEWEATPVTQRIATLESFRDLLVRYGDGVCDAMCAELGKPLNQAREEIEAAVEQVDAFAAAAPSALAAKTVAESADRVERLTHSALGTVGAIGGWYFPLLGAVRTVVPALLTGNAALFKPSEFASLSGLAIADLLWEAGVPPNVLHVIVGAESTGSNVLDRELDGVLFTGTHATALAIAARVAPRFIPLHLELGGNASAYVAADADVDGAATELARGAFYNCGQSSGSIERIYVQEDSYDDFVDAFLAEVRALVVGDPADEETTLGPLTRKRQLGKLELQVADAVQRGAELRAGGKRKGGRGYFFEPTVLTAVDHSMTVMREPSLGPIVGVMAVTSDEEAVVRMRDTEHGVSASIFSSSQARAERLLRAIDTGTVYWNACHRFSPRLPWSGRRNSSFGFTASSDGLRAFLHSKSWFLHG